MKASKFLPGILAAIGIVSVAATVLAFPDMKELPAGWRTIRRVDPTSEQLVPLQQKFGCPILSVSNTVVENGAGQVQVNLVACGDEKCAARVRDLLVKVHQGEARVCLQDGGTVAEFVGKDVAFVLRSRYDLGFLSRTATYDVSFEAAPLREGDWAKWNDLFQSALAARTLKSDSSRARLEAVTGAFSFSSRLCLAETSPGGHKIEYSTEPAFAAPSGGAGSAGGGNAGSLCFQYAAPPLWEGVPDIRVRAHVTVEAFTATPVEGAPGAGTVQSTPLWPSDSERMRSLSRSIVQGASSPAEKLERLLAWVKPGANLRYDGKEAGSRCGVEKVLDQGQGRCWDFSDVFVTLCRASGLNARQVGGWLVGRSGHVWAEVYVEGEGWVAVDPTSGTRCDTDYVPLWTSESGMPPLVYLGVPEIRKVS